MMDGKKIFLAVILMIIAFQLSIKAMYKVEKPHVPLMIIIDQKAQENIQEKSLESMLLHLKDAVEQQASSILVSQAILYNFLYRKKNFDDKKHPENKVLKSVCFDSKNWAVYHAADSQFYLLLPIKIPEFVKIMKWNRCFTVDSLKRIETETGDYFDFIERLDIEKHKPPVLQARDFEKFLKTTEDEIIWDIFIEGHGDIGVAIAGLSPNVFQDFLLFFNNRVNTGIFIADSCYLGGTNLELFRFKKDVNGDFVFFTLNYLVVAMSVEDSPTSYEELDFNKIFSITANLGISKKFKLENLILELRKKSIGTFAYANIPQLILPGGIEIQSLTPDKKVKIIGKVAVKAAEAEEKAIDIQKTLNVLLYPQIINVPINIYPEVMAKRQIKDVMKLEWKHVPVAKEIILNWQDFLPSSLISNKERYPLLLQPGLVSNLVVENLFLYPNFISMVRGDAVHLLKEVNVLGGGKQCGVIKFIRDTFLDLNGRSSQKIFLIEKLKGLNDIPFLLETLRAFKKILNPHDLEIFLKNDESVELNNVIIVTKGKHDLSKEAGDWISKIYTKILFNIKDTAWQFDFDADKAKDYKMLWNFRKIDASKHFRNFLLMKRNLINFMEAERKKYWLRVDRRSVELATLLHELLLESKLKGRRCLGNIIGKSESFPITAKFIDELLSSEISHIDLESVKFMVLDPVSKKILIEINKKLQSLEGYFRLNSYFGKEKEIREAIENLQHKYDKKLKNYSKIPVQSIAFKKMFLSQISLLKDDLESMIEKFKYEGKISLSPRKAKMNRIMISKILDMKEIKNNVEKEISIRATPLLLSSFMSKANHASFDQFELSDGIFRLQPVISPSLNYQFLFDDLMKKIKKAILDDLEETIDKIFLISELQISKDFVMFFEIGRVLNGIKKFSELEKTILSEKYSKFKNFVIKVHGSFSKKTKKYDLNLVLSFCLGDKAWCCELDTKGIYRWMWDFKKIDKLKHENVFKGYFQKEGEIEEKKRQKTLGEVLQKKVSLYKNKFD